MTFKTSQDLFLYTRKIIINKKMTVPPKLEGMCSIAYANGVYVEFLRRVKSIDETLPNKDKLKLLNQINAWLHS